MAKKLVKLQILGMKGDNRNLTLMKDLVIPNAIDGHFEVERETAEALLEKFNIADEPRRLAKEGDPDYSAPVVEVKVTESENIDDLKESVLKANGKVKVLEQDIEALEKELDLARKGNDDKAFKKLEKENEALMEKVLQLEDKLKAGVTADKK